MTIALNYSSGVRRRNPLPTSSLANQNNKKRLWLRITCGKISLAISIGRSSLMKMAELSPKAVSRTNPNKEQRTPLHGLATMLLGQVTKITQGKRDKKTNENKNLKRGNR